MGAPPEWSLPRHTQRAAELEHLVRGLDAHAIKRSWPKLSRSPQARSSGLGHSGPLGAESPSCAQDASATQKKKRGIHHFTKLAILRASQELSGRLSRGFRWPGVGGVRGWPPRAGEGPLEAAEGKGGAD
jgi:hypothetical protein